ncbi:unnamed protein product [Bursaphelenchus xylophilus]|uniref:(pine wood nematode) hypothetical protein n=1 Tax=Bursaphelenchus xylophilus TaxID=6326 RepID=A0A1I7RM04_BURXY|nr:unnamed protein product [Bursaphelenchus xylophilus]CAG9118073.1 unnamed protein product [Bursaphelenchus xylophilus]
MTVAPTFSGSDDFYHPRRSSNNLNNEIEHVMRLMANASMPTTTHSTDINNNYIGSGKGHNMFGSTPPDQCLYIHIPKDNRGGLF